MVQVAIGASAIKFTQTPTAFFQAPPKLGEHNAEVFAEFGIPGRG